MLLKKPPSIVNIIVLGVPSVFPSIKVFSNELALCIRWPKYWSFSFSISPSNEYSGVISFRIDWLDLLAVQGTLKSLLQHHSSKASILWCSAFFMVQLSHPYMTTGKTIALTAGSQHGRSHPWQGHAEETWQARQIRTRGTPWTCSSIYPKTKVCLSTVYYVMPFTNFSDISRGLSLTTFLWKKST